MPLQLRPQYSRTPTFSKLLVVASLSSLPRKAFTDELTATGALVLLNEDQFLHLLAGESSPIDWTRPLLQAVASFTN